MLDAENRKKTDTDRLGSPSLRQTLLRAIDVSRCIRNVAVFLDNTLDDMLDNVLEKV
jgi:hypothetical protein